MISINTNIVHTVSLFFYISSVYYEISCWSSHHTVKLTFPLEWPLHMAHCKAIESEFCILSVGLSSPVKTVLCLWRHSSYKALESTPHDVTTRAPQRHPSQRKTTCYCVVWEHSIACVRTGKKGLCLRVCERYCMALCIGVGCTRCFLRLSVCKCDHGVQNINKRGDPGEGMSGRREIPVLMKTSHTTSPHTCTQRMIQQMNGECSGRGYGCDSRSSHLDKVQKRVFDATL